MKLKNFLVFYKDSNLAEHRHTIAAIKRIFDKYKLKARFCKRNKFNKEPEGDYDLVLSVGGDGTLLRAAYSVKDTVILGINSNVKKSEGSLCSVASCDLEEKLKRAIEGNFSVKNFTRARAFFRNSRQSYDALNEVYIGSATSYFTSRYILEFGKIKEEQKSSGIVVSTGLGSTAWYNSIAGENFNPEFKELRFIVREPYNGRLSDFTLRKGKITGKEKLSVKSKMKDAVVAVDSIMEVPLDSQEEVQITISPKPAKFVVFE